MRWGWGWLRGWHWLKRWLALGAVVAAIVVAGRGMGAGGVAYGMTRADAGGGAYGVTVAGAAPISDTPASDFDSAASQLGIDGDLTRIQEYLDSQLNLEGGAGSFSFTASRFRVI